MLEVKEHLSPLNQEHMDIQHTPALLHQASVELQSASESSMQEPAQPLSKETHSKVTDFQEIPETVQLNLTEPSVLQKPSSPSQPNTPNLKPSSLDVSHTDLSEHQESQPLFHDGPTDPLQSLTQSPKDSADMALTASPTSSIEDEKNTSHDTSTKAQPGSIQLADTYCSPREPNFEDKLASPEAPSSQQVDETSPCSGESQPATPTQFQLGLSECSTETQSAGPSNAVMSVQKGDSHVQDEVLPPPSPGQHPEVTLEHEDQVPTNPACLQPEAAQELSTLNEVLSSTSSLSTHTAQKFTDSAPCSPPPALYRPTQHGESQPVSSPQPRECLESDPQSRRCTARTEVGQKSPLRRSTELEALKEGSMQAVIDEQTLERSDICPTTVAREEIAQSQDGGSQVIPVQNSSSALSLDQSSPQIPTPESLVHRSPSEEHSSLQCSPSQLSPQNLLEEKLTIPLQDAGSSGSTSSQGGISHHRDSADTSKSSASLLLPEEASEVELSDQFTQVNQLAPSPSPPCTPSDSLDRVIVVPTESSSSNVGPQDSTSPTDQNCCQTSPFETQSGRSTSTSQLPASYSPQHWKPTETIAATTFEDQRPSDGEILHTPPRSSKMNSSDSGRPTHVPRSPCEVNISPPPSPPQANVVHCRPSHDSGPTLGPMSNLALGDVVASPIKPDSDGPPAIDNLDSFCVEPAGGHSLVPATALPDRPSTPESCRASACDQSLDGSVGGAAVESPVHHHNELVTSSPTQESSLFIPQGAASLAVCPQSAEKSATCSPVRSVTEPSPRPISPAQPHDVLETPQAPAAEEDKQQVDAVKEQDEEQSAVHSGE